MPKRMSKSLRFIARHMIWVKSKPEAPTTPPTATNSGSAIAIPAMAPATPEREFKSEIVIGMSAPPTRMAKIMPKAHDKSAESKMNTVFKMGTIKMLGTAKRTTVTSDRIRDSAVQSGWPFNTIGRCGRTLWSLPAATRLPVKVSDPTKIASPAVMSEKLVSKGSAAIKVRIPASMDAPPPNPFNSPTI